MKKKYIQLGVIALLLAVMVGVLVLLNREPEIAEPESSAAVEAVYVYQSPSENEYPKEIKIHNENGDFTVDSVASTEKSIPDYTIKGWEKLSLDTYSTGQAGGNAKSMAAKRLLIEEATSDDLKTFGFASPRATVQVSFESGTVYNIELGDNAPGSEGVYAKLKNENKIYLISDSIALPFFKPATAYVNKTVTATDPEYKGFDKITLSGTDYPEPIVIERTPETEIEAGGVSLRSHSITSPINRGADSQKALEPLSAVYGLLAYDVVAVGDTAENLGKYKLSEPAVILSVASAGEDMTFTLRISETNEDGNVHVIKDGSPVIYEMPASSLPFLGLSAFDMMDKMVVTPNIDTIDKVKLTRGDKVYLFDVTNDDNVLTVTLNGEPLPDTTTEDGKPMTGGENFRKLYQTMLSCRYDEVIPRETPETDESENSLEASDEQEAENAEQNPDSAVELETEKNEAEASSPEEPATLGTPVASIEYIYNNGRKSDIVSFYEGPPRKVIIELNGNERNYGQSTYLDRLLEDADKVGNGIAVKTYL